MKCEKCKSRLRQKVSVFVEAWADARSLNKKAIRKKDVTIDGVGWNMATFFCPKCGWFLRLKDKDKAHGAP